MDQETKREVVGRKVFSNLQEFSYEEFDKGIKIRERRYYEMLDVLMKKAYTYHGLMKKLGFPESSTHKILALLRDDGFVVKRNIGSKTIYGVKKEVREELEKNKTVEREL